MTIRIRNRDNPWRVGPQAGTGAQADLRTGGTSGDWVTYLHVLNTSTTTNRTFKLYIGTDAAGTRWVQNFAILPEDFFEWEGERYLASGEVLRWNGETDLTIELSGMSL